MKKQNLAESILLHISRFVSFFLVISAVTTVAIMLLLKGMTLDEAILRHNAPVTFLAVLVMTLAGCALDALRRRIAVERPLRRILSAMERLRKGDYSVRLEVPDRNCGSAGLRQVSIGINALAKELSGVETLRSDFIANVSHELKTPLAVIQNYATILMDPSLPESKRQVYTEKISQTTHRLADMVSNILRLNKLENQQIFPQTEIFDLGEQLAACLLNFETAWEEKQLEIVCDLQEEVRVCADPELLQLVWNNLFSNAIKFTPEQGKITLRMYTEEGWVVVSVSDTGCGMSRETGVHIFEKFYQGDTAHATKGNGLGLALVKRVVDITGGMISVSSTPGKGSQFTVRLEEVGHG